MAVALDLFGSQRMGKLRAVQQEMLKRGEIERSAPGVFRWAGRPEPTQIREAMWRVIRARRAVKVSDLMELTGASEDYAQEYLRMLIKREVVKRVKQQDGELYRLAADSGIEAPRDESKADRLRRNRLAKKEALAALDDAFIAINRARMAITATD